MGKINEEVSKCYDNDSSFSKAYDEMNTQLEKLSTTCDLDSLFECYENKEEEKIMCLDRVYHTESNGEVTHHVRLLYQDDDGDFSVQCTQQIFDIENRGMMIGLGFIQQIQQLAYIGYRLCQSKTWEEREVKELFIAE